MLHNRNTKLFVLFLIAFLAIGLVGCDAKGPVDLTLSGEVAGQEVDLTLSGEVGDGAEPAAEALEAEPVAEPAAEEAAVAPAAAAEKEAPEAAADEAAVEAGTVLYRAEPKAEIDAIDLTDLGCESTWDKPCAGSLGTMVGTHPVQVMIHGASYPDNAYEFYIGWMRYPATGTDEGWDHSVLRIGMQEFEGVQEDSSYWIVAEPMEAGYYTLELDDWRGLLHVDQDHNMSVSEGWQGHRPGDSPEVYEHYNRPEMIWEVVEVTTDYFTATVTMRDSRTWMQTEDPSLDLSGHTALMVMPGPLSEWPVGEYDEVRGLVSFEVTLPVTASVRNNIVFVEPETLAGGVLTDTVDANWVWSWTAGFDEGCVPYDEFIFFDLGEDNTANEVGVCGDDNPAYQWRLELPGEGYRALYSDETPEIVPADFVAEWGPIDLTGSKFSVEQVEAMLAAVEAKLEVVADAAMTAELKIRAAELEELLADLAGK